jgi:hypothetical protein
LQQSILRLLGNRILNAVAGLFRTDLETFSGVFGSEVELAKIAPCPQFLIST